MFRIRSASPEDAEELIVLILELAKYEKLIHEANPDAQALSAHLSEDAHPRCEAVVAEDEETNQVVGFALYFYSYSTFLTRWGIYLEDLYVLPAFRGRGIGFSLLKRVAKTAVARGCLRLEWNVLEWNDLAISFYKKLGAIPMKGWRTMRLTGEALNNLGL